MTYVELIVVLGIFSVMASVSIFNYGKFQSKIDIKNLANDIALKYVEAQKSSVAGKFSTRAADGWKPSYGVHIPLADPINNPGNKLFYYFADIGSDRYFTAPNGCNGTWDCIEQIQISKNNSIKSVSLVGAGCNAINVLTTTYKRPNLTPTFVTDPVATCNPTAAEVEVQSPDGTTTAKVIIYASGRIQID